MALNGSVGRTGFIRGLSVPIHTVILHPMYKYIVQHPHQKRMRGVWGGGEAWEAVLCVIRKFSGWCARGKKPVVKLCRQGEAKERKKRKDEGLRGRMSSAIQGYPSTRLPGRSSPIRAERCNLLVPLIVYLRYTRDC